MTHTILYEGHNLTLKTGTGIATYGRMLAATARQLGHRTDLLTGINTSVGFRDPERNEIAFFDARPVRMTAYEFVVSIFQQIYGLPFGIRLARLGRSGTVVPQGYSAISDFESVFVSPFLFDAARHHFNRHGRRATLRLGKRPDLFHATHPTPLRVKGRPNVYTLHDIVPLRLPYTTWDDKGYTLKLLKHLCRHADHIVTVSEFSRQDIIKFFGMDERRISNTYQSVSIPPHLLAKTDDEIADEVGTVFNLDYKEYFLFFGAVEPKKNVARLIDAYALANTKRPLVIAGTLGWLYDDVVERINDERFLSYRIVGNTMVPQRQVRRLGYLTTEHLVALVRGARAVCFPSLYEGFGLPVLEAMLLGTPVLTSNVSSLPEVAGDAAVLVNPLDVDEISRAIRTLDEDADLRAELGRRGVLRAAAFSPERYRARIDQLYRSILG